MRIEPLKRAYAAATVIHAQKRVLKMAHEIIERMAQRDLMLLRPHGDVGIITLNDLCEHLKAAYQLKVRQEKRRPRR